jgi:hypothetical protein
MTDCAAGDEDGFSRAASHHYRSLRTQMLREVLALARRGALRADWRDALQPPQRSTTTHYIYTTCWPSRNCANVTMPLGNPAGPATGVTPLPPGTSSRGWLCTTTAH